MDWGDATGVFGDDVTGDIELIVGFAEAGGAEEPDDEGDGGGIAEGGGVIVTAVLAVLAV